MSLFVVAASLASVLGCSANTDEAGAPEPPPSAENVGTTEQALSVGWKWIGWDAAGVYHTSSDINEFYQVDTLHYGNWIYHTGNVSGWSLQMCSAHYGGSAGWIRCDALR